MKILYNLLLNNFLSANISQHVEKSIRNCKNDQLDLHRVNKYVSRIPNISCMKSCIEGRGRAVLGNTADSACNGLNWLCCLARPSHALQSRISCKIYLESLKHTRSPCAGPIDHSCNFIYKILSVLCFSINMMFCRTDGQT